MTNSNGATINKNEVELARDGIVLVNDMYEAVDHLNGVLDDLTTLLDKDSAEYREIHDFYIHFPTYNELDRLKERFTEMIEGK
jgi:hypothetical protein